MTQPPSDGSSYQQFGDYRGQQQPYGGPPQQWGPPPKKSHTLRNVLIILTVVIILFVGGCVALLGAGVNEAAKSIAEQSAEPGGVDNPITVKPGAAFGVRDFDYLAGWRIRKDALGGMSVENLRVKNNRGKRDSSIVEIKLWGKGDEVLALADCSTEPIAPGTTTGVSCVSADKMPAKKAVVRVTINDTF